MLVALRTRLQITATALRRAYFRKVWGMTIGRGTRISGKAVLDFTNPRGIKIGDFTIVTPGARIFTHDFVGEKHVDTHIGSYCFIGANALVMPGVTIGDHCVVAAGAVVVDDVPGNSMVAGNPARVIRNNIETGVFGMMSSTAPGLREKSETGNLS
ncbi:MAG: acyltransferase [Alphaproteobacteria bacterium]|nr:MAG: acyltransferase [Alphaproteobacteria bacterium]